MESLEYKFCIRSNEGLSINCRFRCYYIIILFPFFIPSGHGKFKEEKSPRPLGCSDGAQCQVLDQTVDHRLSEETKLYC